MLYLIDRQLLRSYFKAYLVCLVSLLSMYVVVDLFMNLDDFAQGAKGVGQIALRIGLFYGYKAVEIFDRLSEPVVLLAAMFTVAWMQRNNEILPLLSAGVSTRRVLRPVLIGAGIMLGLSVINQELFLPRIDTFLVEHRTNTDKEVGVHGAFDANGVFLSGSSAVHSEQTVKNFVCVAPASANRDTITTVQAKEARYLPATADDVRSGGWMIIGATAPELPPSWKDTKILEMIVPGKFFLRTEVDFDALIRSRNWFSYVDTPGLLSELNKGGASSTTRLSTLATVFHMRITRPILGILLVFMGLSIILQNHQRNIYISAGLCLVICLVFFACSFFCRWLGDSENLLPALAAWLPVFVFGPLSFVMFDAVHT
ncbi:MAG: LptF/LptG family permease [Gemmataceae bacterium]